MMTRRSRTGRPRTEMSSWNKGRKQMPAESDPSEGHDEPKPSFVYEAPSTSSTKRTLCVSPSKYSERGHVILELRDCAEHEPSVMML